MRSKVLIRVHRRLMRSSQIHGSLIPVAAIVLPHSRHPVPLWVLLEAVMSPLNQTQENPVTLTYTRSPGTQPPWLSSSNWILKVYSPKEFHLISQQGEE